MPRQGVSLLNDMLGLTEVRRVASSLSNLSAFLEQSAPANQG